MTEGIDIIPIGLQVPPISGVTDTTILIGLFIFRNSERIHLDESAGLLLKLLSDTDSQTFPPRITLSPILYVVKEST